MGRGFDLYFEEVRQAAWDSKYSEPRPLSGPRLLLSDGTVPVDAAALKEAMLDHAMAKQQEEDC